MSARPVVSVPPPDIFDEYVALLASYGAVQKRCTCLFASQAAEIERLQAETMRLRAAIIVRDTALAVMRDELAALNTAAPGLSRRRQLVHQLELQQRRIQRLVRERTELRQRLERSGSPGEPMHACTGQIHSRATALSRIDVREQNIPATRRRMTLIERLLLTVGAGTRATAQRWKRIRVLRI
jgi:chromosome segregation ATPase